MLPLWAGGNALLETHHDWLVSYPDTRCSEAVGVFYSPSLLGKHNIEFQFKKEMKTKMICIETYLNSLVKFNLFYRFIQKI